MQQPQSPLALNQSPIKNSRKNYGKSDAGKDKLEFGTDLAREIFKGNDVKVTEKETNKQKTLKTFSDVVAFIKIPYTTLFNRKKHPKQNKKETYGPGPETTIHHFDEEEIVRFITCYAREGLVLLGTA